MIYDVAGYRYYEREASAQREYRKRLPCWFERRYTAARYCYALRALTFCERFEERLFFAAADTPDYLSI